MNVNEKTFEEAFISAEQWIANESSKKNGFFTYNDLNVLFNKKSISEYYLPMLEQLIVFLSSILIAYIAAITIITFITRESINHQKSYSMCFNYNIKINNTECIFVLQNDNKYKKIQTKKILEVKKENYQNSALNNLDIDQTQTIKDLSMTYQIKSNIFKKSIFI